MLNALVLGSPRDMRNSHLHHPEAMTDGSETHPLTNLERHGQRGYQVTRNTEGEGRNMPVRNEGGEGAGKGGRSGDNSHSDSCVGRPCKTSDASGKPGLFTGRGAFGRGWSFGGEVVLLAGGTG